MPHGGELPWLWRLIECIDQVRSFFLFPAKTLGFLAVSNFCTAGLSQDEFANLPAYPFLTARIQPQQVVPGRIPALIGFKGQVNGNGHPGFRLDERPHAHGLRGRDGWPKENLQIIQPLRTKGFKTQHDPLTSLRCCRQGFEGHIGIGAGAAQGPGILGCLQHLQVMQGCQIQAQWDR